MVLVMPKHRVDNDASDNDSDDCDFTGGGEGTALNTYKAIVDASLSTLEEAKEQLAKCSHEQIAEVLLGVIEEGNSSALSMLAEVI